MEWRELGGNWLVVPDRPTAMIHFLGGAFVAAAPQITYRSLLEHLAEQGYAVVATPFVNTFDHEAIARQVLRSFLRAEEYLLERVFRRSYVPLYGLGHSMGCKLHLLIGSRSSQERAGNIFLSFNNYPARRSIPFLDQMSQFSTQFSSQIPPQFAPLLNVEFTPSPTETYTLIERQYQVRRNLLIRFAMDDIDQTRSLSDVLTRRFPDMTTLHTLGGNHLTPMGQDLKWQPGATFTPLDALGQFVQQGLNRDFIQLKRTITRWLNPVAAFNLPK